jgi:hypothetical protein
MRPDGEGQNDLRNVLSAYAQYNPDLGYCQGMHCLAGCMLMQMPAEVSDSGVKLEKKKKEKFALCTNRPYLHLHLSGCLLVVGGYC